MIRSSEVEAPQFPTALSAISIDRLLDAYGEGPARLARAIDGVGDGDLRTRAIPGKWAIQEIVLHLADSELVGGVRVRKVLSENRPDLPGYNQELFATGLDYLRRDAPFRRAALHGFRNLRETTAALFGSAAPGDWKRDGMHPIFGPLTLRQLLEMYADHGERHIGQILELRRRLGVASDMSVLLPALVY
ncbi:MAG: DinB family protein [Acidobacteriota bacterium]|nr:DinB family protein [Acidobacteriota bacterium]